MRAVIERAPLLAALIRIKGVVENKTIIPILSNVCVTLEAGRVVLRATDLDMEAIEIVAASVDEPGETTVPADKLHDIVRNADPGAQITMSTERGNPRVIVQSGRSRFQLPAIPATDFPTFPVDELSEPWPFAAKTLADMINRVGFIRGALSPLNRTSATLLNVVDGELHVMACSNLGIALRREPAPEGAELQHMVLPKFTNQVIRWLSDVEGEAMISSSATLVRVVAGGSTLTTKVYDDSRVEYARILLDQQHHVARTDQDALSTALRRAMIMGDQKHRTVRLSFSDGGLAVSARTLESGEGADEIGADYDGPEINFLMRDDILAGALASLKGDGVELAFAPAFDPKANDTGKVVVRAPCDPALTINLMTMRA